MANVPHIGGAAAVLPGQAAGSGRWVFSLPLLLAAAAYCALLWNGAWTLQDGDTFWHIAAGRWILEHRAVPVADAFSHTMAGGPWTAHEWLAEVLLAWAFDAGGWTLVVAVSALAYALTVGLLARALLQRLEPIYVILFTALAAVMTAGHALARPHLLAMPLLLLWSIQMAGAAESRRAPSLWLLPVMVIWANLHAGFVFGIALAMAFAADAVLSAAPDRARMLVVARQWALFVVLAAASALLTPLGVQGFLFTWQVLAENTYSLRYIVEWQSPNFDSVQPLTIWLLGGLALVLYQGLKLPAVRVAMLVGLLYISLKHARNIELLGLVGSLIVAKPFGDQWRSRQAGKPQLRAADDLLLKLARPAGAGALVASAIGMAVLSAWMVRARPPEPPASIAPAAALHAVQQARVTGPVLNDYTWGGFLIYRGIPVFIDGRTDIYGDAFMRPYVEALQLTKPGAFEQLLDRYHVSWTLLHTGTPAIALLDRLPGWRRLYADETVVVHVKTTPAGEAAHALPER